MLEIMHPECILEWVKALDLQISEAEFKEYAQQMVGDGDLVGAAILISKFNFHAHFDIRNILWRLVEDLSRIDVAKSLVADHLEYKKLLVETLFEQKNIKGAVKIVKELGLKSEDFP